LLLLANEKIGFDVAVPSDVLNKKALAKSQGIRSNIQRELSGILHRLIYIENDISSRGIFPPFLLVGYYNNVEFDLIRISLKQH
jgi:hypothetical protein